MKGIIDRFEGEYAVININDKHIDFPKELLPEGASEGDHLKITLEIDQESTRASKERVESLLNKLKNKR